MVFRSNVQVIFKCSHESVTDISMPIDRLTSAVTRGAMSNQLKLISIKICCNDYICRPQVVEFTAKKM